MIDPNKIAEAAYDRLDDQGQLNAAEMREVSGLEVDAADFSTDAIRDRNPDLAFNDDLAHHDESNQKGGLNTKAWQESFADPEQAKINKAGIEAVKAALQKARA